MKTENNILRKVNSAIALFAFLLVSYSSGYSQCNLACNSNVQVSLDNDCSVVIMPDMLLEGAETSTCTYTVSLETADGTPIPNATVTSDHIGMTITAQINDGTGNSCWGSILVEDKLAPVLTCPSDITVQCYETLEPLTPAQFIAGGHLSDNCGDATVSVVSDVITDIGCTDAYDHDGNPGTPGVTGFSAVRTITYIAQDASGNVSNQCSYQIFFQRVDLYDNAGALNITWPADQNVNCGDYATWDNQLNNMGVPELNGTSFGIYPNTSYCELNATYSDVIIELCGAEYKVIREWTVLDWCSGEIARHNQIIKVEQDPLNLTTNYGCGNNFMGISDSYSCTGSFQIPSDFIQVLGLCTGTSYTYEVHVLTSGVYPQDGDGGDPVDNIINSCDCPSSFPGIFQQVGGTYADITSPPNLTGLTYGCNWVRVEVTTECGETQDISFEVLIEDTTPPNPVCDQHTTVTVGPNGWAVANATSFDDGSFDFCSDNLTFGVVRIDGSCSAVSPGAPTVFGSYGGTTYYEFEKFCCSDIGSSVDVQMVVVDESGNWNVCTVEVIVQDASDLDLDDVYSCLPSSISPSGPFNCGAESATNFIVTGHPSINTAAQNVICYNYFVGNPDNYLSGRIFEDTDHTPVGDCGDFKYTRTWGIYRTDLTQGLSNPIPVRVDTCSSTINITVQNTFSMSSSDWPGDVLNLTGCINADTSPSTTGSPDISSANTCSLVADSYTDQVFNFVDDACYKILRTWTVIDWCQYKPNISSTIGKWEYVQVIKVNDDTAPVPFAETTNIGILNKTGCAMMGTTNPVQGNDNCGNLTYSYSISPYPGFISSGGPSANNSVTGLWNEGSYSIAWTVMDACGNSAMINQAVNVIDSVAPTPYCLGAISTVLMESTGTVTIWASDFDLGSTDNCDSTLDMYFGNGSSNLTFDCDDLGQQLIQVYFEDDAGNSDFCTVSIDIQDNLGACTGARIAGEVYSEMNEMLDDVDVNLLNVSTEDDDYDSTSSGQYEFIPVTANDDYQISASKEDDYMNGVSTLDLVLIQKHLLSSQLLNSPYKLMAADINNSGSVSAIDLVELRKLILGIYTELPSNESWRFVDAQQTFANVNQPWPFTEVISINQITSSMIDQNFVAVKIGDVNNTALANATSAVTQNRSDESLDLSALTSIDNDTKVIAIKADNYDDIIGWQTTFNIEEGYEFAAINPGALTLTHTHINPSVEGMLAISYNSLQGETIADDAVLFSIVLRAKTNNNLLNSLTIGSDIIETEAYTSDLEVLEITLRDDRDNLEGTFSVLQNTPNPFSENTSISFNLPERAFVTMTIFDVTGRSIKELTKEFDKGFNTVELSSSELNASGVLYYRIDAGSYTATKKMISL